MTDQPAEAPSAAAGDQHEMLMNVADVMERQFFGFSPEDQRSAYRTMLEVLDHNLDEWRDMRDQRDALAVALAAERDRADGYALLVQELRAALQHAGVGLAGTYAYMMQRGDPGNAADVLTWIDEVDAILAADPEARASELLERRREGR